MFRPRSESSQVRELTSATAISCQYVLSFELIARFMFEMCHHYSIRESATTTILLQMAHQSAKFDKVTTTRDTASNKSTVHAQKVAQIAEADTPKNLCPRGQVYLIPRCSRRGADRRGTDVLL